MSADLTPTTTLQFDGRARWLLILARAWRPLIVLAVLSCVSGVILGTKPDQNVIGLTSTGLRVLVVFAGALTLWITNAVPLVVTALAVFLGLVATGVAPVATVASWYWRDVVFFLLGAFLIAGSLSAANVVDHVALRLVGTFGTNPRRLRFLLFGITFFASMLMSEHAVMALCFPLAIRIRDALRRPIGSSTYVRGIFFALAWGATIGGIVTYLGGARNALAMGFVDQAGGEALGFFALMGRSLPLALILAVAALFVLEFAFPCDVTSITPAREALQTRRRELGRFGPRQIAVTACLIGAILGWAITGPKAIALVAMTASVILLATGLVKWRDLVKQVPWDLLLLYGSALALAKALEDTGAHRLAAESILPLLSSSPLVAIALVATASIFLTETISNAAVVSVLVPLLLGLATQIGLSFDQAALAVCLPAGLAFMLPMGSPPLAIAFASGEFKLTTMAGWGFLLNLIGIGATVLTAWLVW